MSVDFGGRSFGIPSILSLNTLTVSTLVINPITTNSLLVGGSANTVASFGPSVGGGNVLISWDNLGNLQTLSSSPSITVTNTLIRLNVASGQALTQSGAVANVATFNTTGAGSFEVGGYIDVTAFTAGTVGLQVAYTDPGGTGRVSVMPLVSLAGTPVTTVGSLTDAQTLIMGIRTSGVNTIVLSTVVTAFTGTYSVWGWIKQIV